MKPCCAALVNDLFDRNLLVAVPTRFYQRLHRIQQRQEVDEPLDYNSNKMEVKSPTDSMSLHQHNVADHGHERRYVSLRSEDWAEFSPSASKRSRQIEKAAARAGRDDAVSSEEEEEEGPERVIQIPERPPPIKVRRKPRVRVHFAEDVESTCGRLHRFPKEKGLTNPVSVNRLKLVVHEAVNLHCQRLRISQPSDLVLKIDALISALEKEEQVLLPGHARRLHEIFAAAASSGSSQAKAAIVGTGGGGSSPLPATSARNGAVTKKAGLLLWLPLEMVGGGTRREGGLDAAGPAKFQQTRVEPVDFERVLMDFLSKGDTKELVKFLASPFAPGLSKESEENVLQ